MRLRAAYDSLFKSELRKKWDRKLGVRGSSRASSSSTGTYRSPSYSSTSSSSRGYADPFEQFKSAEAQQRWREENPTPEELGDSFGELFNDFANAVGKAVVGSGRDGGDWSSVMNEVGGMSQSGLESLLVSRDRERLENELESTKLVQETLKSRIERLKTAVSDSESDLERFRRQKSSATSSMSRSFESDLEKDVRRQREQLQDARKSLERQQTNAERIQLRIAELVRAGSTRSPGTSSEPCYSGSGSSSSSGDPRYRGSSPTSGGGGGSSYGNSGSSYRGSGSSYSGSGSTSGGGSSGYTPRRSVPSVEDELARLKKKMGK